ncbi:MarR family transcriptional regulator [Marmoricola endophyticus]|uniref:MarR family transcriptional regulator n=1 Tax=Marmoricola endophyticus TaxID=2040280 RepID=A0A917BI93_9ACTN|nr:MarR family transcriptional regulator [Marmoricola endophyticus]GGF40402.1 MarR family transcriptional regulator [Marmoricola endophyticus]
MPARTPVARDAALEDLVCFDLYAASRAMTAYYRPLLAELDLTYPQYLVLVLLAAREAPVPVGEVGRELRLDHGTLTPLLRRLEAAGRVTRVRSRSDERVVEVAITEEGRDVHGHFAEIQCRVTEALGTDAAGLVDLQRSLRRLADSVEVSAR